MLIFNFDRRLFPDRRLLTSKRVLAIVFKVNTTECMLILYGIEGFMCFESGWEKGSICKLYLQVQE